MTMHVLVVFESMFGNTADLAAAVGEGLTAGGAAVTVEGVAATTRTSLSDVDLLVLAAPTHAFSLSRPETRADAVRKGADPAQAEVGLRDWVTGLDGAGRPHPPVAVFDTRVETVRRLPGSAAKRTARLLRHLGFTLVTDPLSFYVADVKGPLVAGERDRARAWGTALLAVTDHAGSGQSLSG